MLQQIFNRKQINIKLKCINRKKNNTYKNTFLKGKKSKTKKINKKTNIYVNIKSYDYIEDYPEFKNILLELREIKKIRKSIYYEYGYQKKILTPYTQEYTQHLSMYINKNKYNKFNISNAYIKLWEIYETFDLLPKNEEVIKMFHIAELPGQFINCTNRYIKKMFPNSKYEWYANSLNPYHKKNREVFGNQAFRDVYGYLKNNRRNWLWGADGSGDLFNSKNILWYYNYIRKWISKNENNKIHIVTGDAGMSTILNTARDQQLLEFAQCVCSLSTCTMGSHTIIKTFTPYQGHNMDSDASSGYFINLIYLYYLYFEEVYLFKPLSSRPSAGEFYVIGKNFKGISYGEIKKLCQNIDNFKLNHCIFKKDEIPKQFINDIIKFLSKMKELNLDIIKRYNSLLVCLNNKKTELSLTNKQCNEVYNSLITGSTDKTFKSKFDKLQKHKFEEFITKFNL